MAQAIDSSTTSRSDNSGSDSEDHSEEEEQEDDDAADAADAADATDTANHDDDGSTSDANADGAAPSRQCRCKLQQNPKIPAPMSPVQRAPVQRIPFLAILVQMKSVKLVTSSASLVAGSTRIKYRDHFNMLTSQQRQAVPKVFDHCVSLVHGPPGCAKTATVIFIVAKIPEMLPVLRYSSVHRRTKLPTR